MKKGRHAALRLNRKEDRIAEKAEPERERNRERLVREREDRKLTVSAEYLAALAAAAERVPGPRTIPWPMPGNRAGLVQFDDYAEWQKFFLAFALPPGVAGVVRDAFDRARKLYLLSWVDFDLAVVGEATAMSALELALRDCYQRDEVERRQAKLIEKAKREKRSPTPRESEETKKVSFARLLEIMVKVDALADEKIPLIRRTGGTVVPRLTGDLGPSLADMRNIRAHGNPFGSGFEAGLLELVRDLIAYAYRKAIKQAAAE